MNEIEFEPIIPRDQMESVHTEQELIPLEREEPKFTEGQMRLLRKQYITVQLPRVLACGHRLDLSRQPRQRNCQHCWFAWFQNHGEIVQQLDEMFNQEHGAELIMQLQGKKFLHRWRQFMATIAQWQQEQENAYVGESQTESTD